MAMEWLGTIPGIVRRTILVAIPKPSGGERLIALLSTFYRVWARLRSPLARQWEKEHDRDYFACKGGAAAIDAVHEVSFFDEWARAKNWFSAAVASDLSKCYEHVLLDLLYEKALLA